MKNTLDKFISFRTSQEDLEVIEHLANAMNQKDFQRMILSIKFYHDVPRKFLSEIEATNKVTDRSQIIRISIINLFQDYLRWKETKQPGLFKNDYKSYEFL